MPRREEEHLAKVEKIAETDRGAVEKQGLPLHKLETGGYGVTILKEKFDNGTAELVESLSWMGVAGTNARVSIETEPAIHMG